jgi:hypothetical protein
MLVCGLVLVVVLGLGARWSTRPFTVPEGTSDLSLGGTTRSYVWYCSILLTAGLVAGAGTIGVGGRLIMRLLAVTSDDAFQGALTEAEQRVGEITVDGTLAFVFFTGVFGGVAATVLYLLVRRFLPGGPWGGVVFGLGLLVVFGATLDPLRRANPDFDIIGPGWLSVLSFTALAVAFGVALQGWAARLSSWLPLPAANRSTVLRYLPVILIAVLGYLLTIVLAVIGVIVVLTRVLWSPLAELVHTRGWIRGGRIVTGVVVVACMPILLVSAVDIITR